MSETIQIVLFFVACGVIYWIVSSIGNKIVDRGGDAISNAYKRKKNSEDGGKVENLSDRYQK